VYRGRTVTFVRTNVVLDRELVEQAMDAFGFTSIRDTIDFALRQLVGPEPGDIRDLHGIGWDGDFKALRGHEIGE
jgi:Arc/MetJ family transcription regulator